MSERGYWLDPVNGEITPVPEAPYGWTVRWDKAMTEYGFEVPINYTCRPTTKEEAEAKTDE